MSGLFSIEGLEVRFPTDAGDAPAVRGIDLAVDAGETVALVGESGCGKSVTALATMRLIARPGRVAAGRVLLRGEDLLGLPEEQMRKKRGREIGMIFQEPMTSLNPVFTVGQQIAEVLVLHRGMAAAEARQEVLHLLEMVGISAPDRRIEQYPHELSGGMKQRVMIAMAIACRPALLIADEPTTALDVTIQAQILDLLKRLQRELGMAILLITHDLGVVAQFARRVAVMYAGKIVEQADVRTIFKDPRHPYTRALLAALPRPGSRGHLEAIPGQVPSPLRLPPGCAFAGRCPRAMAICPGHLPRLASVTADHRVACWLHPGDQPLPAEAAS